MKKLLFLLAALFLVSQAAGEVQYSIETDRDRALMNATVSLDCGSTCPGLNWLLPEGSEIVSVRDSQGKIRSYDIREGSIQIPGEAADSRDRRVIRLETVIEEDAEEIHSGLYKRTLQLPGFRGERTSGFIRNQNLVSGRTGFGFESSFGESQMRFRGEGPVNVRIKFGDGHETEYFSFFGAKPDDTGTAYEVPVGTLGLVQDFERFPVAVMDDDTYDSKVNSWSAGEYFGGAIQIRQPESIEEDFIPVLAHEVVHGLNDRELTWDQTRSSYFDEGTGKYVEYLVKKRLEGEQRTAELFGDEKTWTQREDGQRYRYTLPPKGDKEQLWNYYQKDRDFMKQWSATSAPDGETRKFGYAYSELLVRNYVARMNGSLRQLYKDLEVERGIENPEEKWNIYSRHLDMRPCDYDSRQRFESCLEDINSYDYPVYSAKPDRTGEQLDISRLEIPENTPETSKSPGPTSEESSASFRQFVAGFLEYIGSVFLDAFRQLK